MSEYRLVEMLQKAILQVAEAIHDHADATRDLATQIRLARKEENNE
jgi:hypothetical protein